MSLTCLLVAAACTHPRSQNDELLDPTEPTRVIVENQALDDMTIYAVRGGQRIRIGRARGNTTTVMLIPPSVVSGLTSLSFQAELLGGRRYMASQQIPVNVGDQVEFYIPSN